jgi:branched-chain amino acid aminotransferase
MTATVWFNGSLVTETLTLDPSDRGLTLGDGLFETIAVFNGKAVWLADHLDRLLDGAAMMGLPVERQAIEAAVAEVLAQAETPHGILRITLTRGPGLRGLAAEGARPSLLITLIPWVRQTLFTPVRLMTASFRRNETSPVSRLKTLSYADNILAARAAAAAGSDDALFLNKRGHVAATTIANVFILRGSRLSTPRVDDGVLPGIARAKLLAIDGGEERKITPTELSAADAVFLTNSLRLVRPVHVLDGRTLRRNDAAVAGFFDALCRRIAEECGIDPREVDAL